MQSDMHQILVEQGALGCFSTCGIEFVLFDPNTLAF